MKDQNKHRILYLMKILYERTDEDHPISTPELIRIMEEEYGITVYRTTLADDIEQLKKFGIDIYTVKSRQNKYYLIDRLFEISELKLLVDAVESSRFISAKKSKELVSKISSLTSDYCSETLRRNLYTDMEYLPENRQIFYIIDAINDAINKKRKISFQYSVYNTKMEHQLKHNGELYILSPYMLVFNNENYYVVGYSEKHGKIVNFRVDRIYKQPKILDEKIVPLARKTNLSEYVKTMFGMFNSKREKVVLECDNSVIDSIIDKFGNKIKVGDGEPGKFTVEVEVATSHIFYSWVFGFGGKVKIKSPRSAVKTYKDMIDKAAKAIR